MVRLENVCFGFEKDNLILKDVSFCVEDGGLFGICGPSGCGKTTLARLICGLLKPVSGTITSSSRPRLVMQFPERQLFARTVIDDVMYGPLNLGMEKVKAREAAVRTLDTLGLDGKFHDRPPFSLSGGEKRLVAIAGILAMDPSILVLDEPTAGLDASGESALVSFLRNLHAAGRTILIVSHDDVLLNSLCTESFNMV